MYCAKKNHVKSQELLKQNKSQDKEDNGTTIEDDDVECLGNTITLGENDQTAFCSNPTSNDLLIGQLTETNSTLEPSHSANAVSNIACLFFHIHLSNKHTFCFARNIGLNICGERSSAKNGAINTDMLFGS